MCLVQSVDLVRGQGNLFILIDDRCLTDNIALLVVGSETLALRKHFVNPDVRACQGENSYLTLLKISQRKESSQELQVLDEVKVKVLRQIYSWHVQGAYPGP